MNILCWLLNSEFLFVFSTPHTPLFALLFLWTLDFGPLTALSPSTLYTLHSTLSEELKFCGHVSGFTIVLDHDH